MKTGEIIKEIRQKNNLTQKELAEKLGVTYQAVSKWETGKNIPDISILCSISEKFNIDIEELLTGKKTKEAKQTFKKVLIIITILLTSLLIFTYIYYKNKPYEFIGLTSSNNNFEVEGVVAFSKNKSSVYISKIIFQNQDEQLYSKIEVILYELNGNKHSKITTSNNALDNKLKLSELLKNVTFKVNDFSRMCKTFADESLYIEIYAINDNGETINYKIPLILDKDCP